MKLLTEYQLGSMVLKNRIAMAPMTRCRAIGNIANSDIAEYYAIRADGGLLITEGTAPSPNGLGYARIPGIYNEEQIEGWKEVTGAVHEKGGKIFLQIMHTGRVSHPDNMVAGSEIVAPSAIAAKGDMWTDTDKGMQAHPTPREMTLADIAQAQDEYVQAAKNAIEAGFDGVEIHSANGYLGSQFINPESNQRTDGYGGSYQNRAKFVLEVAQKTAAAIGADKTGIRLSPYGTYNDMPLYGEMDATYVYLAEELNKLNLAYMHLLYQQMEDITPLQNLLDKMRAVYHSTIIYNGGLDQEKAEQIVANDDKAIVSFGSLYLANPDLVERYKTGAELNTPVPDTFFTPGEPGFLDYKTLVSK